MLSKFWVAILMSVGRVWKIMIIVVLQQIAEDKKSFSLHFLKSVVKIKALFLP